ncbi:MAG: hypothetical protein LBR53_06070 [Deltaproteobacteria bacterium]|jgi:hypothetical protein|nr:hypothetical protein [Deltaproteobacteria bacterium]
MTNSKTSDDWIDKARIEIYEETKNMSIEEKVNYFRKYSEEAAKKYGLVFKDSLDELDVKTNLAE